MVSKKLLSLTTAVALASMFMLTGCSTDTSNDADNPENVVTYQSYLNPTVQGSGGSVATVNTPNGDLVVSFLGAGYPTDEEMSIMLPDETWEPAPNSALIPDQRVVAISLSLTNTGEPLPVAAVEFGETVVNGTQTAHAAAGTSLHAMLGFDSLPDVVYTGDPTIQSGATGKWALDILIPTDAIGNEKVDIKQTVIVNGTPVDVSFTVNLKEKTVEQGKVINGEEDTADTTETGK